MSLRSQNEAKHEEVYAKYRDKTVNFIHKWYF